MPIARAIASAVSTLLTLPFARWGMKELDQNRRDAAARQLAVTRIAEGLMRWTLDDGGVVHEMSECLGFTHEALGSHTHRL